MKRLLLVICLLIPAQLLSLTAAPQSVLPVRQAEIIAYRDYGGVCKLLNQWQAQYPTKCTTFTYGRSSAGKPLTGLHIKANGPAVLLHASIHGNEPLSTTVLLSYASKLLTDDLGKDRDIYLIPVLCPDSYPNSRYCDGVDPNRNFNGNSIPPIAAVKKLFLEKKFKATWSGHTYGRLFMYPYGDTTQRCPDDAKMGDLYGRMGRLAGYRLIRGIHMYNHPIFGSELDWYYRNGASSIVVEYGLHQHIPSRQDTEIEFDRTWRAFLLWLSEAPILLSDKKVAKGAHIW